MASVCKKLDFSTPPKTNLTLKVKDELNKASKSGVRTKDLCEIIEQNSAKKCFWKFLFSSSCNYPVIATFSVNRL